MSLKFMLNGKNNKCLNVCRIGKIIMGILFCMMGCFM